MTTRASHHPHFSWDTGTAVCPLTHTSISKRSWTPRGAALSGHNSSFIINPLHWEWGTLPYSPFLYRKSSNCSAAVALQAGCMYGENEKRRNLSHVKKTQLGVPCDWGTKKEFMLRTHVPLFPAMLLYLLHSYSRSFRQKRWSITFSTSLSLHLQEQPMCLYYIHTCKLVHSKPHDNLCLPEVKPYPLRSHKRQRNKPFLPPSLTIYVYATEAYSNTETK